MLQPWRTCSPCRPKAAAAVVGPAPAASAVAAALASAAAAAAGQLRVPSPGLGKAPKYTLRCNAGVLDSSLPGDELALAPAGAAGRLTFAASEKYGKGSGVPRVSIRAAAAAQHRGQAAVKCRCKKPCFTNKRCACVKAGRVCGRHCACCRNGGSCDNWVDEEEAEEEEAE